MENENENEFENEEEEEVVPVYTSNENIATQKSYKRSESYKKKLQDDSERLQAKLQTLKKVQRTLYNRESSNKPNNEFIRQSRLIQGKIYAIQDKLRKIKQNERELEKELQTNLIQTVGDIGTLPIVRGRIVQGRIGSNEKERALENGLTRIGLAKQFPTRLPLDPIAGKRQRDPTINTNFTKRLRIAGGSKKRKSRTMKKRK